MKQTILDSSFIVMCIKQKIDFFEDLKLRGFQIIIPKQVIAEIKRLKNKNAELALKILQKNKFKTVDLGKGHVDKLIIRFAEKNKDAVIATLDREIKSKTKNHKLVIRSKNKLELI